MQHFPESYYVLSHDLYERYRMNQPKKLFNCNNSEEIKGILFLYR